MTEVCKRCDGIGMRVVARADGQRYAEECECRQPVRIAHAFRRAGIPPKYQEATLESYRRQFPGADTSLEVAHRIAKGFADNYPALITPGRGLIFSGSSGLGKTHLAVSILKVLVLEKGCGGLFCYYQQLLKDIQNSWNPQTSATEVQVLEPVLNAEVLVLDDLGSVKPTDWVWDMVSMVLNTRYNHTRFTIVTTNFENLPAGSSKEQTLGDRIGDRMRSRLVEMCREVRMRGLDYRETLARDDAFSPKNLVSGRD